jgi:hypothetical protein
MRNTKKKKNTEPILVTSKEIGVEVMLRKLSTYSSLLNRMQDKIHSRGHRDAMQAGLHP